MSPIVNRIKGLEIGRKFNGIVRNEQSDLRGGSRETGRP